MSLLSSILIIFLNLLLGPPKISGTVVDKDSNKPISYVSIGIINTPYGTYSAENGRFEMELVDYSASDSLRFSCIGYYPATFSVNEFLAMNRLGMDTIFLRKKVTKLAEVVIYSNQFKTKTIGNKRSNKLVVLGFIDDLERGVVFTNNKNLYLKNISFKLTTGGSQAPDSAIFRFNVYKIKDGSPHENILTQPIYLSITSDGFNSTNEFDISKYNISIDEDFAATFEVIRQYGKGRIYFAGWLTGLPTVSRIGKQGSWIEAKSDNSGTKLHQSLKIEVLFEK